MNKSELLSQSSALLSRIHVQFMKRVDDRFRTAENAAYFERLLRVQDRAFCRDRRRYQSWFSELQQATDLLLLQLPNSANAVQSVTSDCLCSDGIGEESDVTTNSGACAAPLASTPDRSIDATLPVSMASGQGGTYPGTCDICGETYDDLDASRTCTQCAPTRAIQCRAVQDPDFEYCDCPDCAKSPEQQIALFGSRHA